MIPLTGCKIYVHDAQTATGLMLDPLHTPCGRWEHNQFSLERSLSRAVQAWPWRVPSIDSADLVFIDGLALSRWCAATIELKNMNAPCARLRESENASNAARRVSLMMGSVDGRFLLRRAPDPPSSGKYAYPNGMHLSVHPYTHYKGTGIVTHGVTRICYSNGVLLLLQRRNKSVIHY